MFILRLYLKSDLDAVIALWELCNLIRPWNNPEIDIFRKLAQQDRLFLFAVKDDQLIASVMGGYDGHRGWGNDLAVHPDFQRNGIAAALIQPLEKRLIALGCPILQWFIRQDNNDVQNFDEQLGNEEIDVICLGKRLIPDK